MTTPGKTISEMPGAHNYDGAPTLPFSPAEVILAQTAAPFAAAGLHDPIGKAWSLLCEARERLFAIEREQLRVMVNDMSKIDLVAMERKLSSNTKSRGKTVKKYLRSVMPDKDEFQRIWSEALSGGKVFTRDLQRSLISARETRLIARNRASAASRTASKSFGKEK